jgi:hypothetical protein
MANTIQERVTPVANTPTNLFTMPAGKIGQPLIMVNNTDQTNDHTFQCFLAMQGHAHLATQAMSPLMLVRAGSVVQYPIPLLVNSGDVVRVSTDGDSVVTFTVSSPITPRR